MNKGFFDDPLVARWIPEEIVRWLSEIVKQNVDGAKNDGGRKKVIYKTGHTLLVVNWGNKLLEKIPDINNTRQAMLICFLHDVGRFPQVKENSYSDISTGVDHATLGVKMISELGFEWEKIGCREAEIMEAVMWHSRREYPGKNLYAKMLRDADKLACFEEWNEFWVDLNDRNLSDLGIKKIVWERLERMESIDNRMVESKAEYILNLTSWLWNLNFEVSKKEVLRMGVVEKFIEKMRENGNSEDEIKRLEINMTKFRSLVT